MGDAPQQRTCPIATVGDGEDVERPGVWRTVGRGNALQAVLAAGHVGPFEGDLEGDLREGERQQGEIEPAAAQDDQRR